MRGVFLGGQGQGVGGAVEEGVDEAAHGGFGEVAAFAVVPFFVLFEEDGADEAGDGAAVGEDLDDVGAAFDLAVESFDGVVGPEFAPVVGGHVSERGQVGVGAVEHVGDVGEPGLDQVVGDVFVAGVDGFGGGLGVDGADQSVDGLGAGGAEGAGDVAGEVDPAALPGGAGQDRFDGSS